MEKDTTCNIIVVFMEAIVLPKNSRIRGISYTANMARTSHAVQVGKRKLELSNLNKVLWPEDGVTKAELIFNTIWPSPPRS